MKQKNKSIYKFKSKNESRGHSAWKGFQKNTATKNPVFHNLKLTFTTFTI